MASSLLTDCSGRSDSLSSDGGTNWDDAEHRVTESQGLRVGAISSPRSVEAETHGRYGRSVIDIDARHRLPPNVLHVLDALVEMTNTSTSTRVSRQALVARLERTDDEVAEALSVLVDEVRRIAAFETDAKGRPTTFSLVYVPEGDAYAAYRALVEPFDASLDGWAPRRAMEQWQGRWKELTHIDFDAGLEELEHEGWAQRRGDFWRLTPTGSHLGSSRLGRR